MENANVIKLSTKLLLHLFPNRFYRAGLINWCECTFAPPCLIKTGHQRQYYDSFPSKCYPAFMVRLLNIGTFSVGSVLCSEIARLEHRCIEGDGSKTIEDQVPCFWKQSISLLPGLDLPLHFQRQLFCILNCEIRFPPRMTPMKLKNWVAGNLH